MGFEQLYNLLIRHLQNLNKVQEVVNHNTVYCNVLPTNDGMGGMSSSALYELLVKNALKSQNSQLKTWPNDWLNLSVWDLAESIR